MASMEGLVPITRAFLASYYDKYPFAPLSGDVNRLTTEIRSMATDLCKDVSLTEGEHLLVHEAECQPPHKIDENMWKNREQLEEIIYLLESSHWPKALRQQSTTEDAELASILGQLKDKFDNALKTLKFFQSKNSESVFNTVMTYMPQDFRGTLIRQQRERSERNKQAEVDTFVSSGGSIRDQYALLWKQQMERRRQLSQLGSATGVYKTLVKYLVGVPQVLLDFIRQINDDHGQKDQITILEEAVDVYTSEFERFIKFMGEVFANSPFFITAEVAGTTEGRKDEDYKETSIPAGRTFEVSFTVESLNSYIAWDFSLSQGKVNLDIGFSVEHTDSLGQKTLILPYRRYESDQGNFCTVMAGHYRLLWDNSYSTFFRKVLRYKVDCIPPVTEPVNSASEVEE
ncbi:hypothetical protein RHMOL_Rhmol04G0186300 [Rhododendron molle]|uniref:Uncharacterized protein n=3 Tax=Rhododendron molle TaxID=49168 RepID=A0ACC0P448_RHOML|nr:hypothetical protein RHMOL_Rhmol04G0186300 [Rhododendron molle]KAI8559601.1 hypothetical protein RHMOL_Rhmol04G0186300 [Rhododendron molle]KAI8559603.1 hypothetical protein RHMOL_Rhmol04G0186300 [Rhododendron molle]